MDLQNEQFLRHLRGARPATGADEDPSQLAKDISVTIFPALGVLLLTLVCMYVAIVWMDRRCRCCPGYRGEEDVVQDITEIDENAMDQGVLAKKAELYGLTIRERKAILLHLAHVREYKDEEDELKKEPMSGGSDRKSSDENPSSKAAPPSEDDVDHSPKKACPICLAAYAPGDSVMCMTTCRHTFHTACGMNWFLRQHDHCPYCRKEIVTPEEMTDAANVVLGSTRVEQMKSWQPASTALVPVDANGIPDPLAGVPDPLRSNRSRRSLMGVPDPYLEMGIISSIARIPARAASQAVASSGSSAGVLVTNDGAR